VFDSQQGKEIFSSQCPDRHWASANVLSSGGLPRVKRSGREAGTYLSLVQRLRIREFLHPLIVVFMEWCLIEDSDNRRNRNKLVGIVSYRLGYRVRYWTGADYISLFYYVQTWFGADSGTWPFCAGGLFLRAQNGKGVKLAAHSHLVPRSRTVDLYLHSPIAELVYSALLLHLFSTPKVEATCSSEMSVHCQRTTLVLITTSPLHQPFENRYSSE
jgi:hypothetical protein